MRGAIVFVLSLVVLCRACDSLEAAEQPESSVVFIEVGYMDNATFVKVEQGTGFIVHPSGFVVTTKHVSEAPVPPGKIRYLRGALKSKTATPNPLFEVPAPVVSADISLLRFSPVLRSDWPYLKIKANHTFDLKDKVEVDVYGFPGGREIAWRPGFVTEPFGPNGSIGINAGLAPGMSGGPVLLAGGRCVVGVVVGGSEYPTFDYFTPTQYAKTLLEVPPAEFVTEISGAADGGLPSQAPLFDRSFRVNETYNEHKASKSSKMYSLDFRAEPGARVVSARLVEESVANASDTIVDILGNGTKATLKFRLESGFDRLRRGWWHGQVVLTEQRAPQRSPQSHATCN